jgi:hypothetical protein
MCNKEMSTYMQYQCSNCENEDCKNDEQQEGWNLTKLIYVTCEKVPKDKLRDVALMLLVHAHGYATTVVPYTYAT